MQFNLRALIAATTLCAVSCAIFFALPLIVEIPILVLLALVAPSVWICGACFAKGHWRAFFLGGICAGWIPSAALMIYGGTSGLGLVSNGLRDFTAPNEYEVIVRLSIAGTFLLPGLVAFIGGGCGALTYHWFGVEPVAERVARPAASSKLTEPYVVVESRVTPVSSPRNVTRVTAAEECE